MHVDEVIKKLGEHMEKVLEEDADAFNWDVKNKVVKDVVKLEKLGIKLCLNVSKKLRPFNFSLILLNCSLIKFSNSIGISCIIYFINSKIYSPH